MNTNNDSSLGGLETITINHQTFRENREVLERVLADAQKFLSANYPEEEVLSLDWFIRELEYKGDRARNDAYTILVRRSEGSDGKIAVVVVYDVAKVPKTTSTRKLVSDRKNHYTSLLYATAAGEEHEPELQTLIKGAIQQAQAYSQKKHRTNVGVFTDDTRHPNVLKELTKIYGGGCLPVSVPTLDDATVRANYGANFERDRDEKLVVIPFGGEMTKSIVKRIWASALEEGYNEKKPWNKGYRPLTNAQYFKDFVAAVDATPGKHVTFKPIQ